MEARPGSNYQFKALVPYTVDMFPNSGQSFILFLIHIRKVNKPIVLDLSRSS